MLTKHVLFLLTCVATGLFLTNNSYSAEQVPLKYVGFGGLKKQPGEKKSTRIFRGLLTVGSFGFRPAETSMSGETNNYRKMQDKAAREAKIESAETQLKPHDELIKLSQSHLRRDHKDETISPFMQLCIRGDLKAVTNLADTINPIDLEIETNLGNNVAHLIVYGAIGKAEGAKDYIDILNLLASKNPNILRHRNQLNETPYSYANHWKQYATANYVEQQLRMKVYPLYGIRPE